jgi:hypothetical protein
MLGLLKKEGKMLLAKIPLLVIKFGSNVVNHVNLHQFRFAQLVLFYSG